MNNKFKKITAIALSAIMAVSSFTAAAFSVGAAKAGDMISVSEAVTESTENTVTVYYNNPNNWGNVYAYVWEGDDAIAAWPGTQLSANDEGVYSFTFDAKYTNVIFTDNYGGQTADLKVEDGKMYDGSKWVAYEVEPTTTAETTIVETTTEEATTSTVSDTVTVYYNNSNNWGNVYAYVWEGDDAIAAWPGTQLNANDEGVYSFTFDAKYTNIIFTDNYGGQTADLKVEDGKMFDGSKWVAYEVEPTTAVVTEPTTEVVTEPTTEEPTTTPVSNEVTVYFSNPNNWGNVYAYVWEGDDAIAAWPGTQLNANDEGVYSFTFDAKYTNIIFTDNYGGQTADLKVEAGKMFDGSKWVAYEVEPTTAVVTEPTTAVVTEPTTAEATTTPVSNDITVYYNNPNNWGNVYAYVWEGDDAIAAWPGTQLTANDEGVYSFTFEAKYTNIIFTDNYGGQTADLKVEAGKMFNGSKWVAYEVEPTTAVVTEPTTAVVTEPTTADTYLVGDVNLDGDITVDDVTAIQMYLVSITELSNTGMAAADVNGDKVIDIMDATAIQCYLIGITSKSGNCGTTVSFTTEPTTAEVTETTTTPVTNDITVYYNNPNNWGNVYAYVWEGDDAIAAWPGTQLTANDEGVYSFTFDAKYTNIIFTDNYGGQTADLKVEAGKMFNGSEWVAYEVEPTTAVVTEPTTAEATETTTTPVSNDITVYYNNPNNWGNVYAYVWEGDDAIAAWPGTQLTANNEGVYSFTFDAKYTNIIFTDNYGGQTADLKVEAGKMFDGSKWVAYEVEPTTAVVTEPVTEVPTTEPATEEPTTAPATEPTEEPTTTPVSNDITVYYNNPNNWGNVYAYVWEGNDAIAAWPGTQLTADDEGVYSFTFDAKYTNIIFTDNYGGQTADLKVEAGKMFNGSEWVSYEVEPTTAVVTEPTTEEPTTTEPATEEPTTVPVTEPTEEPTTTPVSNEVTVYFSNPNNWGNVYAYVWTGDDALAAWPGTQLTANDEGVYSFTFDAKYTNIIFTDNYGGQTADLTVEADKLYNGSNWVDYTTVEPTDPTDPTEPVEDTVTVYFSNPNNWGNVYAYIWQDEEAPAEWPGTQLEADSNGVYAFTFDKKYTNIIFTDNYGGQTADLTVNAGKLYNGTQWVEYTVA